jgi:hypothetical protein
MRNSKLKLAAGTMLGLAALAGTANAALIIDVRGADQGKSTTVTTADTVLNLNIYAIVTGNNANADETFQSARGSLISGAGGLQGNLTVARVAPFTATLSADGVSFNAGGDTDTERGAADGGTTGNYVNFRAAGPESVATGNGTAVTYRGSTAVQYLVGTAAFTVLPLGNTTAGTIVNWRPHVLANGNLSGTSAAWTQDGGIASTASGAYNPNTSSYRAGQGFIISNTAAEGFTLTTTAANTNLATSGSVQVTGANGVYKSEVDDLTTNANKGSVTFSTPVTGQSTLLLWLRDTDGEGGATIQSTLTDMQANSGGTYTILQAGNTTFDAFNTAVGGTATAAVQFTAGAAIDGAFNWNFGNSHADIFVDRVALAPEPASLGLIGMIGAGLLARRRRSS